VTDFKKGLSHYLNEESLEKISKINVGIAGAGGLGSNCAFNLVRSGFINFKIIDFDIIEPSNLNRQFFFQDQIGLPKVEALKTNLLRINPEIKLEIKQEKITRENVKDIFSGCDIIVEAFDKPDSKIIIVEEYSRTGKFLVCASGLGGFGKSDDIKVHKIKENFFIIGDLVSEVENDCPPLSPRVNIAAAKQADVILEYVLGKV